ADNPSRHDAMDQVGIGPGRGKGMDEVLPAFSAVGSHEQIEDEQAKYLERRKHRHDPDGGLHAEIPQHAYQEDAGNRVHDPAIAASDTNSKEGGQIDVHQSTQRSLAGRLEDRVRAEYQPSG